MYTLFYTLDIARLYFLPTVQIPKNHMEQKNIEGRPQSPVAIVDDVITSGGSAVEALNAVKSEGYDSKCLLSIVYRGGDEQKAKISEHGKFLYIFDEKYFVDRYIKKHP